MSDDELELVYVDEAEPEPEPDRGFQVGVPPTAPGAIEDMYFDEHGPREELPDTEVGWATYFERLEAWEAEQALRIDPGEYAPLEGLSPDAAQLTSDAQQAAQWAVADEAYQRELVDRVAKLAREFDVGPEVVREVALQVELAKRDQFTRYLAAGYDVQQAGRALDDADVDGAIRAGLAEHRYRAVTSHDASLGRWREGRDQAAADRAREGKAPLRSVYESPSLQRMARAMERHAERQRQWDEGVQESYRRQTRGW